MLENDFTVERAQVKIRRGGNAALMGETIGIRDSLGRTIPWWEFVCSSSTQPWKKKSR